MEQTREQTRLIDLKRMEKAVANNRKRINENDRLIVCIIGDQDNGKLPDERLISTSGNYDAKRNSRKTSLCGAALNESFFPSVISKNAADQ